jgi:hypothetical protein
MKTKEITIAGKKVMLGYCFATEISFKKFTGLEIENFDPTDRDHIIYMILSAISTYYLSQEKEEDRKAPIVDTDLMYNASSKDFITALEEIFKLKADWYELPKGEKIEEQPADDEAPKNA